MNYATELDPWIKLSDKWNTKLNANAKINHRPSQTQCLLETINLSFELDSFSGFHPLKKVTDQ